MVNWSPAPTGWVLLGDVVGSGVGAQGTWGWLAAAGLWGRAGGGKREGATEEIRI